MKDSTQIKTRFAPSPTGAPHVGNIRTALFAWLFAKSQGGKFLLRIEDTDRTRYDQESVKQILESLDWLGIDIDEGVASIDAERGDLGPYTQSKRLDIYKKHALKLIEKGKAYYCFCDQKRLEKLRLDAEKNKKPPKYDGHCLCLKKEEIEKNLKQNKPFVIRMVVPNDGETFFFDEIKGDISFKNETIDHQVLLKSDGFPTYHLACVVDDHLMKITHVIRADEWLPSTPKHVLLYKYFGWTEPKWAHLPIILGKDKSKLSKRHGAVSVLEYKSQGYLAEAMVNYLALLGWNPKTEQEIFSQKELVDKFDLKKVNKNNPIFDSEKLDWINHEHIQKLSINELAYEIKSEKEKQDPKFFKKAVALLQERMEKISDFEKFSEFLWTLPEYDGKILCPKKGELKSAKSSLEKCLDLCEKEEPWSEENLRKTFLGYCESHRVKRGDLLWPLRVSVSGSENSPEVFSIMGILGKEESIRRIKLGISKI